MRFVFPTLVDRILNFFKIGIRDMPDEEHFEIVFDCDEFGVVYPRLFCHFLSFGIYIELYGLEAKFRFAPEQSRFLTLFENNAVFIWPDAFFAASSSFIRQDRPSLPLVKHWQAG